MLRAVLDSLNEAVAEGSMALKDLAALYGRVALILVVFAFVAGIIVGPLVQNGGFNHSVTAAQERMPAPDLTRSKSLPAPGKQG